MKSKLLIAGALLVVSAAAAGAAFASAQEPTLVPNIPPMMSQPAQSVTVSGVGTAYGQPDLAFVDLGVESVSPNLGEAYQQTAETMRAVYAALEARGIAAEDLQTSGVSVFPQDEFDPNTGQVTGRTYRVQNIVTVTVRDLTQIEGILTAAVEAGANNIYNLSFGIADPAALEQQARAAAIADARSRAEALGTGFGVTIGQPVVIRETLGVPGQPIPFARAAGGAMMEAMQSNQPVSGGQLSVQVLIEVSFAIGG